MAYEGGLGHFGGAANFSDWSDDLSGFTHAALLRDSIGSGCCYVRAPSHFTFGKQD